MARFISLVIAASIGAVLGSILRPGILEVAIVALVLIATAHIIRALKENGRGAAQT